MGAAEKPLEKGYSAYFDGMHKQTWNGVIGRFADANIFQTWSYDAVRQGETNISQVVLCREGSIVAAAQARIERVPMMGFGAAYARWAPLWRPRGTAPDPMAFRQAIRAMRNEYVCRRRLILRIFPLLFDEGTSVFLDALTEEGYIPVPGEVPGRTLIMDISHPLDEIRKKLDQKWRNCLNRSERNSLEVAEGTDDALFVEFIGLYRTMLDRKRFEEPNDINEFRTIQRELPEEQKMRIFLCRSAGASSAGVICGAVGDTGVYLFGATNDEGMSNKGSYLLQWRAIEWMKRNGLHAYNLNGINPERNPGGYHFKVGLMGKNGRDLNYLGRFDSYPGRLSARLVRAADVLLPKIKKAVKRMPVKK